MATLTAKLDKAGYKPGDTMTLTVTSDARQKTVTVSIGAGVLGNTTTTSTITVPLSVTDNTGRTWTQQSDDGQNAVWTATA